MSTSNEQHHARPPADTRVYAIGDVHGRADLLADLHALIREDATEAPESRRLIVYLGDYVDRGPDSAAVIDLLLSEPMRGFEQVFLMGNHEDFLLHFLDDPSVGPQWMANGGEATLASYGVVLDAPAEEADMAAASDALRKVLPKAHRDFLEALPVTHREGDYLFVHAGIRPEVPLEKQSVEDLLWIREPFLESRDVWEFVVVHGHTPVDGPEVHDNRIAVDTGAVWSGRLTAVVLHGPDQSFLHT